MVSFPVGLFPASDMTLFRRPSGPNIRFAAGVSILSACGREKRRHMLIPDAVPRSEFSFLENKPWAFPPTR